ncbi:MAG TPA: calcium/proton exchanger [Acidimicrobiales bacterium]|nr:calcium/proton exchanger [Acidimicrobiales bacterium]
MGPSTLTGGQRGILGAAFGLTVAAAVARVAGPHTVATFVISAMALAALAALVGEASEQLGERYGPAATGLLQSTLGNLPELFVGIFALRSGLVDVVRAALIGSVLGNTLLVLGIAITVGGLRHGLQRFSAESPRVIVTLLLVAVSALLVPTLASRLATPAASHAVSLSNASAVILVLLYALSIPFWLQGGARVTPETAESRPAALWSLQQAIVLLALGSVGAGFVSSWFVGALEPATRSLGLSATFTGLVIVALASNAVEHAVGIRFAMKARPDYAISTILNSSLQVALLLTPVLVLVSRVVGPTHLTLVFPPLQVAAVAIATIVALAVVYDGEYVWLEGVALIGLYGVVVISFWWG